MRRFFTFSLITIVVGIICVSSNLSLRGQQPQVQPGAAPETGRGAGPNGAPQTGRAGGRGNANNEAVVGAFRTNCAGCHGGGQVPNAPDLAALRQMSPEKIYRAMTIGAMQAMAQNLSDQQKIAIAESLTGRRLTEGDTTSAAVMTNRCTSNPPLRDSQSGSSWNGWSPSIANTRLQSSSAAKLSPGQVSRLKVQWVFGVPGATSMYNEPAVVGGRIYLSSDTGQVYSLDAVTGCVYWSFQAQAGVRSAITIGPPRDAARQQLAYFGDIRGNVYAIDAAKGEVVWQVRPVSHPVARITATPRLYKDRLYVPVASLEEVEGAQALYECCTSRGAVTALDAITGKVIWTTYAIPDEPKVVKTAANGKQIFGPSGAGVWNSPTIDAKRNALYVGTGNGFTEPATKFSDAIIAMDLDSGKMLWSFQAHPRDIWHGGCQQAVPGRNPTAGGPQGNNLPPESCMSPGAPDWDFSASPILATLTDGRDLLIAGQKSGTVWAFDVDKKGALVWSQDVARVLPGGGGEIVFGGAADDRTAYFNLRSTGLVALELATGMERWYQPFDPAPLPAAAQPPFAVPAGPGAPATAANPPAQGRGAAPAPQRVIASSAVTVLPGVVLSAGVDGLLRALSASNGALMWQFNTAQPFDKTVNGVPAKGGSMGSAGPVVVDGMVYVVSGYIGFQRGMPGNVLLAFGTGE